MWQIQKVFCQHGSQGFISYVELIHCFWRSTCWWQLDTRLAAAVQHLIDKYRDIIYASMAIVKRSKELFLTLFKGR